MAKYQGVAPPSERPQDGCDACTKTHINDLPAQYYNYALSTVIKYQLHDHICTQVLERDPHSCNYAGHKEVGDFLARIMKQGATRPWRDVIKEATGEPLSTRAMMAYFAPLGPWLDAQLSGKKVGWSGRSSGRARESGSVGGWSGLGRRTRRSASSEEGAFK